MAQNREYLTTHPWLTFELDMRRFDPAIWMMLGEVISKSLHIAKAPIEPKHADHLYRVFLAKGAAATTAIEGNTLSEDQVKMQVDGLLEVPKSQEYLKTEVQNILDTCNYLVNSTISGEARRIDRDFINDLNLRALTNLDLGDEVVPGEIRTHNVAVAGYRGAPVQDCHYLLDELCNHIEKIIDVEGEEERMQRAILAALFAHVYIALIHPYGDGNGRTSRLLEVYILFRCGFPMPTCQLLSNHYNTTRSMYYKHLDGISKSGGNIVPFIGYALQGFVDGLRNQVQLIQDEQLRVTWINYIHNTFSEEASRASKRRRDLAIEISKVTAARTIDEVFSSSIKLSKAYAALDEKTLTRDLNILVNLGLVIREPARKIRPNVSRIQGFLPWRKKAS